MDYFIDYHWFKIFRFYNGDACGIFKDNSNSKHQKKLSTHCLLIMQMIPIFRLKRNFYNGHNSYMVTKSTLILRKLFLEGHMVWLISYHMQHMVWWRILTSKLVCLTESGLLPIIYTQVLIELFVKALHTNVINM